jgi:hypothetical protein
MFRRTLGISLLALIAAGMALTAVACGDDDDGDGGTAPSQTAATEATATSAPGGTATSAPSGTARPLKDVLTEAINEEYKARATYQAVVDKFGQVAPFTNILQAENSHVEAWKRVFQINGITVPADPHAGKIAAPVDVKAACVAGVAAEKEDVALYDRLMKETTDAEALRVMTEQRKVSQENHLPAFERCA